MAPSALRIRMSIVTRVEFPADRGGRGLRGGGRWGGHRRPPHRHPARAPGAVPPPPPFRPTNERFSWSEQQRCGLIRPGPTDGVKRAHAFAGGIERVLGEPGRKATNLLDLETGVDIWVTHDLDQLTRVARNVVVVVAGRVVQHGTVQDVLARPSSPPIAPSPRSASIATRSRFASRS